MDLLPAFHEVYAQLEDIERDWSDDPAEKEVLHRRFKEALDKWNVVRPRR